MCILLLFLGRHSNIGNKLECGVWDFSVSFIINYTIIINIALKYTTNVLIFCSHILKLADGKLQLIGTGETSLYKKYLIIDMYCLVIECMVNNVP